MGMLRKKEKSSGGFLSGCIIVVIILALIAGVVIYYGSRFGIIKTTFQLVDNREDKTSIPNSDISIYLVDQSDKHQVYEGTFGDDDNLEMKVPAGNYECWTNWDGILYSDGYKFELGALGTHTAELIGDPSVFRCLLLEFYDEDEKQIVPEKVMVTDEEGNICECVSLEDGIYYIELDDSVENYSVRVAVDDYEEITATADLTSSRAVKLLIMLS